MGGIRAQLIFNPIAGRHNRHTELHNAICCLSERGWSVSWRDKQAAGHATRLAQEAVKGKYDAVIVAGGDGTINQVINGLAGSDVALDILPTGLSNVWALEVGIPFDTGIMGAAEVLVEGKTRRIDLGQAGERYFILAAGVGFDGQVVARLAGSERRLGKLSYVLTALRLAMHCRGTQGTIVVDGEVLEDQVLWISLGNLQLYAGALRMATQARLDDGLLDVVISRGHRLLTSIPCSA